jgi:signal transduction histidine kinase/CheY-like chemotaxis protein
MLNDILDGFDPPEKIPQSFLQYVERKIPGMSCRIRLDSTHSLLGNKSLFIPYEIETALFEKAGHKKGSCIRTAVENSSVFAIHSSVLNGVLIFASSITDLETNTAELLMNQLIESFFLEKKLDELKSLDVVRKNQMDRQIRVLKKRNQSILAQNSQQHDQYARRLKSEIKKQTKALVRAREKAETANQAKSLFLANMSHEIRTPLNAILGFARIVQDRCDDPDLMYFLEAIHTNGRSLLHLLNDILDLSKVEAGKMELTYSNVNISQLFQEIQTLFQQKTINKGVALCIKISAEIPDALHLDEQRLRQVLINLIGNAVKFTETGKIVLSADCSHTSETSPGLINLAIKITDTGVGIPEDQLEQIFEIFSQARGQSFAHFGGTGLGLAITRRLVEIMNGSIQVESMVGKGSCFTVTLKDVMLLSPNEKETGSASSTDPEGVVFTPATILIADDNHYNRKLVAGYLENRDFLLLEAENGKQVLEMAEKYRPNLILLDLIMPEMNGYEALERLKKSESLKNIPVIVITASGRQQSPPSEQLWDSYLIKPITKEALFSELMTALPNKQKDIVSGTTSSVPADRHNDLILPPEQTLEMLYDLAMGGNLGAIMQQAEKLKKSSLLYQPFAEKLYTMARNYQDNALVNFIRNSREKQYD